MKMKWSLLIYLLVSQKAFSDPLPFYKACEKVNLSSLSEESASSETDTTAKFCFSCKNEEDQNIKNIQSTLNTLHYPQFKEKLRKRILGQIESKIFQTEKTRHCITSNKKWFSEKNIEWSKIKNHCQKIKKDVRSSIKDRWSDMRINLSLTSPRIREDQILSKSSSWLDNTPSHLISDFSDSIPKLTKEEEKKSKEIYKEALSSIPLKHLSPSEFKDRLEREEALGLFSDEEKKAKLIVMDLREKSQSRYLQIVSEMPVLGYIKKKNPKNRELNQAFLKIEKNMRELLEKIKNPEVDMDLLLSFKPLVENLLEEHKEYCLVAEKARIEEEEQKSSNRLIWAGVAVIAALPCFAKGPLGAGICIAAGLGVGITGYNKAKESMSESLGRTLTGNELETIAELHEKDRQLFLEKFFLPVALFGVAAVTIREFSESGKQILRASKSFSKMKGSSGKTISKIRRGLFKSKQQTHSLDENLRKAKIREIPPKQINNKVKTLKPSDIKYLNKEQIQKLNLKEMNMEQLKAFTREQVQILSMDQIKSVDPKKLQKLMRTKTWEAIRNKI